MRLERLRAAIITKERPGAVKALRRRGGLEKLTRAEADETKASARIDVGSYFIDPEYRKDFTRHLDELGFGKNAVEAEAFGRALPSLSAIDRLVKSAEKRLADHLKRLEAAYGGRDAEQPMPRSMAALRADDRRGKQNGLG